MGSVSKTSILRYAAESDNLRKQAPIRQAFLTEMWFYDKIIPAQLKFQTKHGIKNPFVNYAKCYGISRTDKCEILFLENVKQHGYKMWDRKKPMNHEHLKFVFHEYGRYHGTNYAIKHLNPVVYKELTSQLVDMMELFNKTDGFSNLVKSMSAKLKDMFDPIKEKDYYETIKAFAETSMDHMRQTGTLDDYSVILHGDCWCNNMMFKYQNAEDNTKPDSMQLIDFQLSKERSPVLDLSYFFYVCADMPSFERLDEYLKIYYKSFTEHLAQFGIDSEVVLPFAKLKEHWKTYSKFGLIMAIFLIRIMLSDVDEVPDLADVADSKGNDGTSVMNSFDFVGRHEDEYKKRMRDLIMHLYNNKFI